MSPITSYEPFADIAFRCQCFTEAVFRHIAFANKAFQRHGLTFMVIVSMIKLHLVDESLRTNWLQVNHPKYKCQHGTGLAHLANEIGHLQIL